MQSKILATAAVALGLALTACGSKAEEQDVSLAPATMSAPEEITLAEATPAPKPVVRSSSSSSSSSRTTQVAAAETAPPPCYTCGTISDIKKKKKEGSGTTGAVIGAVVGGVAGNKIAGGKHRGAETAAGAVVGGYAGHEIGENVNSKTYYVVVVAMNGGGIQKVKLNSVEGLSVGQKVRVENGNIIVR